MANSRLTHIPVSGSVWMPYVTRLNWNHYGRPKTQTGKSGNKFFVMNILIIGNLGYIGPVVIAHLHEKMKDASLYGYDIGFFTGTETSHGLLPETFLKAQYY